MTWTLTHNNRTVGEWSDDIVNRIATKLIQSKSESAFHKEKDKLIAEFLPDPIRDCL